jgi:hypothetical protein
MASLKRDRLETFRNDVQTWIDSRGREDFVALQDGYGDLDRQERRQADRWMVTLGLAPLTRRLTEVPTGSALGAQDPDHGTSRRKRQQHHGADQP